MAEWPYVKEELNMPVKDDVIICENVKIWHPDLCNMYGCEIGEGTSIGAFCEIHQDVIIGRNCRLQSFIFIPVGVHINDNVFIGPHVCFTNDKYPKAGGDWKLYRTTVKAGASLGASVLVCPDVVIGKNAIIGAGSVVTKDIPANELWVGNPARFMRKL